MKWLMSRSTDYGGGSGATAAPVFVALTDIGVKRDENQDAVLATRLPDGRVLLAVADGVGGTEGGAAASRTAVEQLEAALDESGDPDMALTAGYAAANEAVESLGDGERQPATTLVTALVDGSQAWIANVGDSRAYVASGGGLRQLTEDHSWVADQVRAGRLTPEEARKSEMRNIITRAVGNGDSSGPDIGGPFTLASGETLVLTSDGLHGLLAEEQIAAVVATEDPHAAAQRLIQMARDAGGPDNISVAIYRAG